MKKLIELCNAFDAGALCDGDMRELVSLARKAAEKKLREVAEHRIPEDFSLSTSMRKYAEEKIDNDPDDVFDHFTDYHRANGTKFVDWEAAWRNWVRNQIKFGNAQPKTQRQTPRQQSLADFAARPDPTIQPRRGARF